MKIERYNRLIKILNSKDYRVDLKNMNVISVISRKSKNKPITPIITKSNRVRIRMTYNGTRYEYELHEIISVFLRKYIVDKICLFKDGNALNCHPSNLAWTDRVGGKRVDLAGKRSKIAKLTKEQVKEIRGTVIKKGRGQQPLQDLADKYNVSRWTIINLRQGKGWSSEGFKKF